MVVFLSAWLLFSIQILIHTPAESLEFSLPEYWKSGLLVCSVNDQTIPSCTKNREFFWTWEFWDTFRSVFGNEKRSARHEFWKKSLEVFIISKRWCWKFSSSGFDWFGFKPDHLKSTLGVYNTPWGWNAQWFWTNRRSKNECEQQRQWRQCDVQRTLITDDLIQSPGYRYAS